jgi:ABC-type transport system involved in cytochrome bd biosynthesis fused ATPase/permease subunit
MLSFVTPAGEAFLGAAAVLAIQLLVWVGGIVLLVMLLVAILKLPALLERVATSTAATNQSLREVLAEVRKATQG